MAETSDISLPLDNDTDIPMDKLSITDSGRGNSDLVSKVDPRGNSCAMPKTKILGLLFGILLVIGGATILIVQVFGGSGPEQVHNSQDKTNPDAINPVDKFQANCTTQTKKPPKTGDLVPKQFIPLETNPVSLLHAMRECPTFTYNHCKSLGSNPEVEFQATLEIRSSNRTFIGYGKKKKDASRDASYHAVLELYPELPNSGLPTPELSLRLQNSICSRILEKPE